VTDELDDLDEFYELVYQPTLQERIQAILAKRNPEGEKPIPSPILMSMIHRLMPQIMAASIVGVQPMTSEAGMALMARNPLPKRLRYD
jgi:hypothetical protein